MDGEEREGIGRDGEEKEAIKKRSKEWRGWGHLLHYW